MLWKPEISAGLMGHLARMQTLPKVIPNQNKCALKEYAQILYYRLKLVPIMGPMLQFIKSFGENVVIYSVGFENVDGAFVNPNGIIFRTVWTKLTMSCSIAIIKLAIMYCCIK